MKNYELFDTCELSSWSRRIGLIAEESYLFCKYILPRLRTDTILDIGTGNGRFLFALARQGFAYGAGIDLAEQLISMGKTAARQEGLPVDFISMDVAALGFKNRQFSIVLALQQIISFISNKNLRTKAIEECSRVLAPGGVFLSSFLHFPGRWYNGILSHLLLPVKILKKDYDFLDARYLPWLQLGNKINIRYLCARQPYLYWFTVTELLEIFRKANLQVIECCTSKMIKEQRTDFAAGGMLYVVAKKT